MLQCETGPGPARTTAGQPVTTCYQFMVHSQKCPGGIYQSTFHSNAIFPAKMVVEGRKFPVLFKESTLFTVAL